jgi:hypothetical protein
MTEHKRLIGSAFPSGRWVMTSKTGRTGVCRDEASSVQNLAHEIDFCSDDLPTGIAFHWPAAMFDVPVMCEAGDVLLHDIGGTFKFCKDLDIVSDDEIRLALSHAHKKFGNKLNLSGDNPIFTARMARLADDMGFTVLNPEMEPVISAHRAALARFAPNVAPPMPKKNWWRRVLGVRA